MHEYQTASEIRTEVLAHGLRFPEGPVAEADGSVVFVEIAGECLKRRRPDGVCELLTTLKGGPNGLAVGPDGCFYICNNGGFEWGESNPFLQPPDYDGGCVQRFDPVTGRLSLLYDECEGRPLRGPNDLVFDRHGGFYFTDTGKARARDRDFGGVYYALADGTHIREVSFPMLSPNGIALSADGSILYVTETETARLWAFDIVEAGCFLRGRDTPHGGRLVAGLPGFQKFDGMALDEEGNICIATPVSGAISVIRPDGALVRQFFLNDPQITNICFGGLEFRTAYITCGGTGELLCAPWPTRGLPLVFDS